MIKHFYVKTFGCQMNFDDSLKISNILINNGFIKKNLIKNSDLIIINTCSVRENSHKKIYNYLYKIYKKYDKLLFVLIGCCSNFLSLFFLKKFDFIKIILGPQNIINIYNLIYMYFYYECKQININFYNSVKYNNKIKNINNIFIKNNYISIMEGCNKYCSYCIVPYTRGKELYFHLILILYKIIKLNDTKVIYLLGQNVTSYKDVIIKKYEKYIYFYDLLSYISEIYNIKNIYFISPHPQDFNNKLIKNIINKNKVTKFIHLPIQSFSNGILKSMRRNYSLKDIKKIIFDFKYFLKVIFLSTDIIVGFYNEKNCDFYKTVVFLEKFLFDKSYIFIYSPRPYTKSYYFFNKIPDLLKYKRHFILSLKLKNNIYYINKFMLGKIEIIYINNYYLFNNNMFIGLTINKRIIKFFIKNKNLFLFFLKKFIKLKIIRIYDVFYGEILS